MLNPSHNFETLSTRDRMGEICGGERETFNGEAADSKPQSRYKIQAPQRTSICLRAETMIPSG